jgi:hypothetical protein
MHRDALCTRALKEINSEQGRDFLRGMMKAKSICSPELELTATCLKTEILTKKWHHMILKSVGHPARVSAGI